MQRQAVVFHLGGESPSRYLATSQLNLRLAIQLIDGHLGIVVTHNRLGGLPDLEHIVLSGAGDKPGIVGIPAKVSEVIGVPTVHEQPVWMAFSTAQL